METASYQFDYQVYDSASQLSGDDQRLFSAAVEATAKAYAPYSGFRVGVAALLANGSMVTGGNQENASFPAGLCAEGVVMAAAAAQFPGVSIDTIAITYRSEQVSGDHPISPCGVCRQAFQELNKRSGRGPRLLMGGPEGRIIVVADAGFLLPFAFTI